MTAQQFSASAHDNPLMEITLKDIICEKCRAPLNSKDKIRESTTVSDLLHSKHLFNCVRKSIPELPYYLLIACRKSIKDYLNKYAECLTSPLEAILEQLRLFNTVDPSITKPLLKELDIQCMRKGFRLTEPNIINTQLPLSILREFVQLEGSVAQYFRHVQTTIEEMVLKMIKIQRKLLPKPYLFQANNVIVSLVAAVGEHKKHLQFVHSIVTEMASEVIDWLSANDNNIYSKPEYTLAIFPLKHLLGNALDMMLFENAIEIISTVDLNTSKGFNMVIPLAVVDPAGDIWKHKVLPYFCEMVHGALEGHNSNVGETSDVNSFFKALHNIEPLRQVPGYVDSGSESKGSSRVVFDYGDPVPKAKFDSLLEYMRAGPEQAQYRTALMVAPSGAGKSFSSTYLAKTGASTKQWLYTIPFSEVILENLASNAEDLTERIVAETAYRVSLAAHLLVLYSCLTTNREGTLSPLNFFKFLRNGGQKSVIGIQEKLNSAMGEYLTRTDEEMQRKASILSKLLLQKMKTLVRDALAPSCATFCIVFDEAQRCLRGVFPRNQYSCAPSQDGNMFTVIQAITSTVCNQYIIGTNLNLEEIVSALSGFSKHYVQNFFDSLTPATFEQSKELLSSYIGNNLLGSLDKVDPFPLYHTRFRMLDVVIECMAHEAKSFSKDKQNLHLFMAKSLHKAFLNFQDKTLKDSFSRYYTEDSHKQVIDELILYGSVQQKHLTSEARAALAHGFCYTKSASRQNVTDKTDFVNAELPMQCIMQDLVREAHRDLGTVPFVSSFAKLANAHLENAPQRMPPKKEGDGRKGHSEKKAETASTLERFLPLALLTHSDPMQFLMSIMEEPMAGYLKNRKFSGRYMYRCQPNLMDSQEQKQATVQDLKSDPFFGLLRYTDLVRPDLRFDPELSRFGLLPNVILLPTERAGPDAVFLLIDKDGMQPAMLVTVSCTLEGNLKKFKKDFCRLSPEGFFSGNDVSRDLRTMLEETLVDSSIPVLRIMVMPKTKYSLVQLKESVDLLDNGDGFCGVVKCAQDSNGRKDFVLLLSNKNKRFTDALKTLPEELAGVWPVPETKKTKNSTENPLTRQVDLMTEEMSHIGRMDADSQDVSAEPGRADFSDHIATTSFVGDSSTHLFIQQDESMGEPINENEEMALSVGGTKFVTTRCTLTNGKSKYFTKLVSSGEYLTKRNSEGQVVIDRNPKHFELILDFLRGSERLSRRKIGRMGIDHLDELEEEATFYGIQQLIDAVKKKDEKHSEILKPIYKETKPVLP